MLEEDFAKVRFLGSDYWIAAGRDGDVEPVDGEFVVVEQTDDKVATSTSGDGKVMGGKHSCEFYDQPGLRRKSINFKW